MTKPYLCPSCKTNRTRFNIIEQSPKSVKLNPQTGEVINEYDNNTLESFHIQYKGPNIKIQCGTCGLIEDEILYVKHAENNPAQRFL